MLFRIIFLLLFPLTQIELLSWKTDATTEHKVKDFINDSVILNISPDIIDYCVSLRRKIKIKTPDAIIASTALVNGYILITNNEKDFKNVKGLKIINPKKL
jgi:predicted nucleic acid-binding protein